MAEIKRWPKPSGNLNPNHPLRIDLAADYGLLSAVQQLEGQWGTIEAYNRLVEHCDRLRDKVSQGTAQPPREYVNASYVRATIPAHLKR